MKVSISRITDRGIVRTQNEDCYVLIFPDYRERAFDEKSSGVLAIQNSSSGIFLCVVDGMGGAGNGDIASQTISDRIQFTWKDLEKLSPEQIPTQALLNAHDFIQLVIQKNPEYSNMGAVATACYILENEAWVSQVGDSRLYHYSDSNLLQITEDQSIVGALIKAGRITKEEAESHPERHIVLQAIGPHKKLQPTGYHIKLKHGDKLLICSDGLSGMVQDSRILEIMRGSTGKLCVENLVREAKLNGGDDNITVILAELEE